MPALAPVGPRSRAGTLLLRMVRQRLVIGVGLAIMGLVLAAALAAPWLAPYDPLDIQPDERLHRPAPVHPFGTDEFGRDIMSRVLFGARLSLLVGGLVTAAALGAGTVIGLAAGSSPRADRVIMRVMDGLMAFPDVLLAIGLMAVLGPRVSNVMVALTVVYTPRMARVVRATALVAGESIFVDAARALGASDARILLRHVLPNCLGPAVVQATFTFAYAVLTEAALGFLGVGAPPQLASWGTIISEGRLLVREASWLTILPGLAIVLTVVGLNLMGDGLRDYLDPRRPAV